jgi:hypothetical protein
MYFALTELQRPPEPRSKPPHLNCKSTARRSSFNTSFLECVLWVKRLVGSSQLARKNCRVVLTYLLGRICAKRGRIDSGFRIQSTAILRRDCEME